MRLKSDAKIFGDIIDDLKSGNIRTNLSPRKQKMLPRFIYHFTEMKNAISILDSGHIYSRKASKELGILKIDSASEDVINYTNDKWKDYVRFYFRPKTPTQYRNEGVRSSNNVSNLKSHCPVPIFFLFDSKKMLSRDDSFFSTGNLAVTNEVYYKATDFRKMPFEYIYHEGSYDSFNQSYIKVNRHAELVIEEKCSIDSLKAIICRSAGERETFLNVLSEETRKRFQDIIFIDTENDFYNGEWTYIESANLTNEKIVFTINKGTGNPVFKGLCKILETSTGKVFTWEKDIYNPSESLSLSLENLTNSNSYEVKLYLDEHFVYYGMFNAEDALPF